MDGPQLKEWRLFMGLKLSDVAQMFGLTEREILLIETGKVPVPEGIAKQKGKGEGNDRR